MKFNKNQVDECVFEFEYELSKNQTLCFLKTDNGYQICIATRGVHGPEATKYIIDAENVNTASAFIAKVNKRLFPSRTKQQNYQIELSATQSIESYI